MVRRILLVNDDGFMTKGLPLMYRSLRNFGEVLIVVPEIPKSGGGHSLTLHKPLFIRRLTIEDMEVHIVNGTPVDAFHSAVKILNFHPDIVFSGVNIGENTSIQNILYSGTVQAAMEAGLFGYPSIAVSADVGSDEEFEDPKYSFIIRVIIESVTDFVLNRGWFRYVDTISINIPESKPPLGVVIPRKTQRIRFRQRFERRVDPRGREYYWLVGDRVVEEGSDTYYLSKGYVTLTPLTADMSCNKMYCSESFQDLESLRELIEKRLKRLNHL